MQATRRELHNSFSLSQSLDDVKLALWLSFPAALATKSC
jgi:hypothetical protein